MTRDVDGLIEELESFPSIIGDPSNCHINSMTGDSYSYQHFVMANNHAERLQEIINAIVGVDLIIWRYEEKIVIDCQNYKIRTRFAAVKDGKQVIILPEKEFDPLKFNTIH